MIRRRTASSCDTKCVLNCTSALEQGSSFLFSFREFTFTFLVLMVEFTIITLLILMVKFTMESAIAMPKLYQNLSECALKVRWWTHFLQRPLRGVAVYADASDAGTGAVTTDREQPAVALFRGADGRLDGGRLVGTWSQPRTPRYRVSHHMYYWGGPARLR